MHYVYFHWHFLISNSICRADNEENKNGSPLVTDVNWCFVKQTDLPSKHQSINNDIFEGWFPKQGCGEHQQCVEPTVGYKDK